MWVSAMRCTAALSWRLPERVSRTRPAVRPDQTGIGAMPECRANAASEVKRASRQSRRRSSPRSADLRRAWPPGGSYLYGASFDALGQGVDLPGELDDLGQFGPGELGQQPDHAILRHGVHVG